MKSQVLSISALLVLLIFLTGCLSYKDVEMKGVEDVNVKEFSKEGIEVELSVRLKNPNNYKISVVDSDIDVFISGTNMGKAKIKRKVVLPRNSDEVHLVKVTAEFKELASAGLPALLSMLSTKSLNLKLKGNIKGRAYWFSRTFPVEFSQRVQL